MEYCFADDLSHGGMREYELLESRGSKLGIHHHGSSHNDLGCVRANHMTADKTVIVGIDNKLYKALAAVCLGEVTSRVR